MMNILTSFAFLAFLSATTGVHGGSVTYEYEKEKSRVASAETFFQGEGCLDSSLLSVDAADSVYKVQGSKKYKSKTAEIYATIYTDCTDKGATKLVLSVFDDSPEVTIDGLESATVSIATTATVQTSLCTVETFVDPDYGYSYKYYSCCDGETLYVPLTVDVSMETYGEVYKERSNGIRKGFGFVAKYKSDSKCKELLKSKFSNFVVGDVAFPLDDPNNYGSICRAKEGTSTRYTFSF